MPNLGAAYLRLVALGVGFFILSSVTPIAMKWLLIGRWKPETIPIWSLRYFRFWLVKAAIRSAPDRAARRPDLQRLSSASRRQDRLAHRHQVAARAGVHRPHFDRLRYDPAEDTIVLGYKAQSNFIHIGPIHVGDHAFVGEASVLDINTTMEDDTQLGHSSSLHSGQRISRGASIFMALRR